MKDLKHNLPIPPIYAMDNAIEEIFNCMKKDDGKATCCMALIAARGDSLKIMEFEAFDRYQFAKIIWALQHDIPVEPLTDEQLKQMGIMD